MMDKLFRLILSWSFTRVYGGGLDRLVDEINSETWLGANIETGGHALSVLKPIGQYEAISIKCVITGQKTCNDVTVKTKQVDYWTKEWL